MYNEKLKWLMILQRRREHFLYKKEPRDFDSARRIRIMQELVKKGMMDYSILESFGLDAETQANTGKLILT